MSGREMLGRVGRLRRQSWARCRHKAWDRRYAKRAASRDGLVGMIGAVEFFGLSDIRPGQVPAAWLDDTVAAAERLMNHEWHCLGLDEITWDGQVNWNYEYKRQMELPLTFACWMNYRDAATHGDFKYYWELPRLQHLIILAKAYFLTGRQQYAQEVSRQGPFGCRSEGQRRRARVPHGIGPGNGTVRLWLDGPGACPPGDEGLRSLSETRRTSGAKESTNGND